MYLPLNSCRMACTLCTLWAFSAPAAHAKTPLFTAREPLWQSKWPLGTARVLLERSEGLFRACFGAASALEMAALACPGAASALKRAAPACFDAASALKIAILACSGAASALKKPARARFSALSHYSKVLVSVSLCPERLYSAQLCSMHGHVRRCSSLLSEITIRKCGSLFHFALNHCTLLCFATCMDMHRFTLVYNLSLIHI